MYGSLTTKQHPGDEYLEELRLERLVAPATFFSARAASLCEACSCVFAMISG